VSEGEPTVRRTVIGAFPAGASIIAFEDVEGELVRAAAARLDAEKAEAERRAKATLVVDREWFLQTMRAHIALLESVTRWHDRRGNFERGDRAAWKAGELRTWVDEKAGEP
jgi:hypothetical protein